MNRKGFTLAETIGVIIVLGLIAIVTVPLVDGYINDSRQKTLNSNIAKIKEAAKNWNIKYGSEYGCDTSCLITLDQLKKSEFLADEKIMNPVKKEELDGAIYITYSNDSFDYEFGETIYSVEEGTFDLNTSTTSTTRPTNKKVYLKVFNTTNSYIPLVCVYESGNELCLNALDNMSINTQKAYSYYDEEEDCDDINNDEIGCSNENTGIAIGSIGVASVDSSIEPSLLISCTNLSVCTISYVSE